MLLADDIVATMSSMADERQRQVLLRFFKTGKGEYGEGDCFLGLKVPQVRVVVKQCRMEISLGEIEKLLYSKWHEVRLCGFLLLVDEMAAALPRKKGSPLLLAERRKELADFYLCHTRQANNWDLVDMSCPKILGNYLCHPGADGKMPSREVLYHLAESDNLWEQRIAMVTNWMLIRYGEFQPAIDIANRLLSHPHDLIHKAVGWMLREIGKRNMDVLEDYLYANASRMHRTSLRYAIEKMSESDRRLFMSKDFA